MSLTKLPWRDIPAGNGKITNLFLQCSVLSIVKVHNHKPLWEDQNEPYPKIFLPESFTKKTSKKSKLWPKSKKIIWILFKSCLQACQVLLRPTNSSTFWNGNHTVLLYGNKLWPIAYLGLRKERNVWRVQSHIWDMNSPFPQIWISVARNPLEISYNIRKFRVISLLWFWSTWKWNII